MDLFAGNLASFDGIVSAPTIAVTSSEISILGSLGVQGITDLVTLNAVSDQTIALGDPPAPGPYALMQSEFDNIHTDSLVFNALGLDGGPAPDIDILGLQFAGSEAAGGGKSNVTFNTAGSILVHGALAYVDAGCVRHAEPRIRRQDRSDHRRRRQHRNDR